MQQLLLVTIPAAIAAAGSVLTAYVSVKVRQVAKQTDGRLTQLENELRLARRLIEDAEIHVPNRGSEGIARAVPSLEE